MVRQFIGAHPLTPHLVIGGIDLENLPEVIEAGGRGIAICAAACGAKDPSEVVARMRLSLQEAVSGDAEAGGATE